MEAKFRCPVCRAPLRCPCRALDADQWTDDDLERVEALTPVEPGDLPTYGACPQCGEAMLCLVCAAPLLEEYVSPLSPEDAQEWQALLRKGLRPGKTPDDLIAALGG